MNFRFIASSRVHSLLLRIRATEVVVLNRVAAFTDVHRRCYTRCYTNCSQKRDLAPPRVASQIVLSTMSPTKWEPVPTTEGFRQLTIRALRLQLVAFSLPEACQNRGISQRNVTAPDLGYPKGPQWREELQSSDGLHQS